MAEPNPINLKNMVKLTIAQLSDVGTCVARELVTYWEEFLKFMEKSKGGEVK